VHIVWTLLFESNTEFTIFDTLQWPISSLNANHFLRSAHRRRLFLIILLASDLEMKLWLQSQNGIFSIISLNLSK
jgi:hypothetical protein